MQNLLQYKPETSPAIIVDRQGIENSIKTLSELRSKSGCRILYSIKALPFEPLLHWLQPHVDGFSVSSLFEAKLAHQVIDPHQSIHLTTPGIRPDETSELSEICSHISFNSYSQRQHFTINSDSLFSPGLRINPKLSFVNDIRYDPCRLHSKLGVGIDQLSSAQLQNLSGLHIHTVFGQEEYTPLLRTVEKLQSQLGTFFAQLKWLNLGGGYLLNRIDNHQPFIDLVCQLREQYALDVYIEPGKSIVGDAVHLIATVLDCFVSDGKAIAVLDTSINHNPEVFEYQIQPDILQSDIQGKYFVTLVGSTCLAGDIFGEYCFKQAVKVGDQVHFIRMGAYSLVKANRFNGYNLPDIYALDATGLRRLKHYDYSAYHVHWQADDSVKNTVKDYT